MDKNTLIFGTLFLWGMTYIIYSHGNNSCLINQEKYFFMTPKYIKHKLGFTKLLVFLLTLINIIIAPFYYLSLIFMVSARKIVDRRYWKNHFKELEKIEKLKDHKEVRKKIKKLEREN